MCNDLKNLLQFPNVGLKHLMTLGVKPTPPDLWPLIFPFNVCWCQHSYIGRRVAVAAASLSLPPSCCHAFLLSLSSRWTAVTKRHGQWTQNDLEASHTSFWISTALPLVSTPLCFWLFRDPWRKDSRPCLMPPPPLPPHRATLRSTTTTHVQAHPHIPCKCYRNNHRFKWGCCYIEPSRPSFRETGVIMEL